MKNRRWSLLIMIIAGLFLLTSCGNTDSKEGDWKKLYLDYIKQYESDLYDGFRYSLVYIDEDDVPELWINANVCANGEYILSSCKGKVEALNLDRIGSVYIPKSGLIYSDTGHMDHYPIAIYELKKGKFKIREQGIYYFPENLRSEVETYEDIAARYVYEWEGKEISKEEFEEKRNACFDLGQSIRPQEELSYSEIVELLNE